MLYASINGSSWLSDLKLSHGKLLEKKAKKQNKTKQNKTKQNKNKNNEINLWKIGFFRISRQVTSTEFESAGIFCINKKLNRNFTFYKQWAIAD